MDLELTRIDYGNVGTTFSNCLKLLPSEYKKQQKVAVGDLDGNLQIFSIKKSEALINFQSYVGKKVSSIQLGGVPGSLMDKIFVASDNVVKGFNKKGKMFLSFDTNLTEPIKCMFVSGADLVTCGNHVYCHYRDCKDIGTYLCGDTIVDVVALCPNNTNRILTILACSGRVLRILEHCRVRQTVELNSVPTVLHVPQNNIVGDRVLCGFADGKVSIINFGPFTGEVKQTILVSPDENPSAVTCIDTYDISGDGKDELIIGRRDGSVQVFTLPSDNDLECRQLYRENFPESISAIQAGCVYSNGFIEIVVLSYAGSIFGLTTQVISVSLTDKEIIKPIKKTPKDLNISIVENQNNNITLAKPQENYRLSTQVFTQSVSCLSVIEINHTLTLNKNDATYYLILEIPTPISDIILQCEASIHILEADHPLMPTEFENNATTKDSYSFSMKAHIPNDANQFKIKFQTMEGQYGNLDVYIVPKMQPNNIQTTTILIRPLSVHIRIHSFDSSRPLNSLTLKGSFTHAEVHNWIEQCIPEVPERLAIGESCDLYFENVFIGTILKCTYGKGNAKFFSDNLSTISILKDYLTKEATKKRIKLEISPEICEASVPHILKLIEPKMLIYLNIQREHKFLLALLQVNIQNDDDFNCLMPEYQSILKRRNEIENEYKTIPAVINRYIGFLTDLFIDRFKFKGIFIKDKIPELIEVLEKYNFDEVLNCFETDNINDVNSQIM